MIWYPFITFGKRIGFQHIGCYLWSTLPSLNPIILSIHKTLPNGAASTQRIQNQKIERKITINFIDAVSDNIINIYINYKVQITNLQ